MADRRRSPCEPELAQVALHCLGHPGSHGLPLGLLPLADIAGPAPGTLLQNPEVKQRHLALEQRCGDPLCLPRSAGLEQGLAEEAAGFDDLDGRERCRGNAVDGSGLGQRRPLATGSVSDEADGSGGGDELLVEAPMSAGEGVPDEDAAVDDVGGRCARSARGQQPRGHPAHGPRQRQLSSTLSACHAVTPPTAAQNCRHNKRAQTGTSDSELRWSRTKSSTNSRWDAFSGMAFTPVPLRGHHRWRP